MRALFLLLLAAPLSAAMSQGNDSLFFRPGVRLRWTVLDTVDRVTGETRFTYRAGQLDSLDGRSLVLRPMGATGQHAIGQDTFRLPMTGMSFAEVLTGSHRHAGRGALAGLVVGAIAGYVVGDPGGSAGKECAVIADILFCGTTPGHAGTRARRTATYAAGGAVAGAIVGYLIQTESWAQIDVAGLRRRLGLE